MCNILVGGLIGVLAVLIIEAIAVYLIIIRK